jgi:hypothetical protein
MQIRELDLKELDIVYSVLKQLRDGLSYKEFEDLIYDMRHIEYKMLGIMDKDELITFAGVNIQTNFSYKRHLFVFDLVTDKKYKDENKYTKMMIDYLLDYAKVGMCENIVLSSDLEINKNFDFYNLNSFKKDAYLLLKSV